MQRRVRREVQRRVRRDVQLGYGVAPLVVDLFARAAAVVEDVPGRWKVEIQWETALGGDRPRAAGRLPRASEASSLALGAAVAVGPLKRAKGAPPPGAELEVEPADRAIGSRAAAGAWSRGPELGPGGAVAGPRGQG